jgi:hypothetical protein
LLLILFLFVAGQTCILQNKGTQGYLASAGVTKARKEAGQKMFFFLNIDCVTFWDVYNSN